MTTETTNPITGADDPRITAFLTAWHEANRPHWRYENLDYDKETAKRAINRSKYVLCDRGSSGAFMVEKSTGIVYGIRSYGAINRKHCYGNITDLTIKLATGNGAGYPF